ncbi:hypothetical protein B0A53_02393 [Rhodotorula sp. CCFEE 5036]|nr:hypothetical protein B0A53_02393 [Rhodotorula sp. CCFEE 5036]
MPSNSHSPKESLEIRANDGELDGGQEALIPLLARTNGADPANDDDDDDNNNEAASYQQQKGRPNRQVRLYAVAGLTLMVFMAYAIVRSVSPARPSYASAKTSVPALDHLLGMLLHTTTPATLANDFLQHSDSVNFGVVPFSDRAFSPVYTPAPLEHALTTEGWSASCLETFVATGDLCAELHGKHQDPQVKMDVVWTWVNGSSSEILSDWMARASQGRRKRSLSPSVRHRRAGASVHRHFRDHDELRFSIRSVLASVSDKNLSTLHLVVGDTPASLGEDTLAQNESRPLGNDSSDYAASLHYAQVPHWTELASLQLAPPNTTSAAERGAAPFFRIHPHSTLFRAPPTSPESEAPEIDAAEWRSSVVPSFNSLAIESQLANLDFTAKTALYLNDDFFLTRELAITDFASPLYGPVFRLQRDLLVTGVSPENTHDSADGEWKGLGYSAWLLDERFGARARPYLLHIAKVISVPLLKEMQQVFISELTTTASSRFRGDQLTEVQTLFLATHYVVEKHREALLWSFFFARADIDGSGVYSASERRDLLAALDYTPDQSSLDVAPHKRTTHVDMGSRSAEAGLPAPSHTFYQFSSADGFAYTNIHSPPDRSRSSGPIWPMLANEAGRNEPICTLHFDQCFEPEFLSAANETDMSVLETFRRIAFAKPECGDCIIALLVGKSGPRGFEAFLPSSPESPGPDNAQAIPPTAIGLGSTTWRELIYEPPVADAAALIQRYAYTLGDTPSFFYPIRGGGESLTHRLEEITNLDDEGRPALIALNDDVNSARPAILTDVNSRLERWFQETWPVPSPWEAS